MGVRLPWPPLWYTCHGEVRWERRTGRNCLAELVWANNRTPRPGTKRTFLKSVEPLPQPAVWEPLQERYRQPGPARHGSLLTMNPCAVSHEAQLRRRHENHTGPQGPKATAAANLPALIPISRSARRCGLNPASVWAWRASGRRHKSKLCPPSLDPGERSPIGDASRATTELVRELLRIKTPLLPPVRFSTPATQKPRPDHCRGGAAGWTCLVTII